MKQQELQVQPWRGLKASHTQEPTDHDHIDDHEAADYDDDDGGHDDDEYTLLAIVIMIILMGGRHPVLKGPLLQYDPLELK